MRQPKLTQKNASAPIVAKQNLHNNYKYVCACEIEHLHFYPVFKNKTKIHILRSCHIFGFVWHLSSYHKRREFARKSTEINSISVRFFLKTI